MLSDRKSFFERHATLLLVLIAFATPTMWLGAIRAVQSNTNKVADWLPKTFVETGDLRWFREHFVGDQFVIVSWEGCRLGGDPSRPGSEPDDPRIELLAQTLLPPSAPADPDAGNTIRAAERQRDESGYFKSVTTARRMLNQLTSPPMDLSYAAALRRLQGSLIGPDGTQTCVIVTLSDDAIDKLGHVLARGHDGLLRRQPGLLFDILSACDIDPDTVHLGGPPVDNVAIDEEGERTLIRLAGLAGLLGLLLAWWSLRSITLTLVVFACGLQSAAASLAAVWLTGETTDAVLLSMPSLVYVLAISGATHLVNYYRDAVEQHGLAGAPTRAIQHGWKPALFCSVTTAMGLVSLNASDLTPIRKFGTYSALGTMLMLLVLFVFLPAALQLWPVKLRASTKTRRARRDSPSDAPHTMLPEGSPIPLAAGSSCQSVPNRLTLFWNWFGNCIIRRQAWVTSGCVLLLVVVGLGIGRIRTSIDLMKLFDSEARVLQDYQWLEAHVGRLVPMEIVLRFDRDTLQPDNDSDVDYQRYSLVDRMQVITDVQRAIAGRFGTGGDDLIGPSMSAVTFVPALPEQRRGTSAVVRRRVTNSKLMAGYEQLCQSGYLCRDNKDGSELWRISVRVAAFKDVDYGRFASDLRTIVDPIVAHHNDAMDRRLNPQNQAQEIHTVGDPNRPHQLSAVYTGVVPIVYKAQRALLNSLIESTFWSFITITPLLMLVSRGIRAGAVAMLPNVLPVLVVFGGMGWLGLSVNIGSMMSASIALGVAVDDTIHYLTWFREDLNATGDRRSAILSAYQRCAMPTLQAALINGLGLSVFAFSTFTPTRQFGFLMLTILLAGVIAELVLLPALLAGPLGRAFRPRRQTAGASTGWEHSERAA